jgi:hypothetical protein
MARNRLKGEMAPPETASFPAAMDPLSALPINEPVQQASLVPRASV